MKREPLTPGQVRHVRTMLDRAIHDLLHELADELERDDDALGRVFARGLRSDDPVIQVRRDS